MDNDKRQTRETKKGMTNATMENKQASIVNALDAFVSLFITFFRNMKKKEGKIFIHTNQFDRRQVNMTQSKPTKQD